MNGLILLLYFVVFYIREEEPWLALFTEDTDRETDRRQIEREESDEAWNGPVC